MATTRDASSGGIGMRFMTARITLTRTRSESSRRRVPPELAFAATRNNPPNRMASTRLAAGPAREVRTTCRSCFRNPYWLRGWGLAYAKTNGLPPNRTTSSSIPGRMRVPKTSTWRLGSNVSRPASLGVRSPKRRATNACAYS